MQGHDNNSYLNYTKILNDILSKNKTLESILIKLLNNVIISNSDDVVGIQKEYLEAGLSLILEQETEIDRLRIMIEDIPYLTLVMLRMVAKNVGASAIIERLLDEEDQSDDLTEALLSLVKSQEIDIKEITNIVLSP
ncbi:MULTISPECIES: hypothetical protein [Serratia]|uniref:hypothetical protein n=1 Tax=Serratia TaxID=613 RepID=UPI001496096A|nr:hypothetical protein [Serratia marcescens]